MASHIILHEVSAAFGIRPFSFRRREHRDPAFLALDPEGTVPVLPVDGPALAEVAGILFYPARRFPAAGLLPRDDVAAARVVSWMSFLASAGIRPGGRARTMPARPGCWRKCGSPVVNWRLAA